MAGLYLTGQSLFGLLAKEKQHRVNKEFLDMKKFVTCAVVHLSFKICSDGKPSRCIHFHLKTKVLYKCEKQDTSPLSSICMTRIAFSLNVSNGLKRQ